jgi:hypothetical protein
MGPKVEAACHFAEATGKVAAIGALKDLSAILRGKAGTTVTVTVFRHRVGIEKCREGLSNPYPHSEFGYIVVQSLEPEHAMG